MNNVFLFNSSDEYFLDEEVKKQIKKISEKEEFEILKFDFELDLFLAFTESLASDSIFSNGKILILKNFELLADIDKKELSQFKLLFEKINENTFIFLINNTDKKIDLDKNEFLKIISSNIKEIKVNVLKDLKLKDYIKEYLNNFNFDIDDASAYELSNRCNNNFYQIQNELEKLMLFKSDLKIIEFNDILNNVSENSDYKIFDLLNNIISGLKEKSIHIYREMLLKGLKINSIIALLFEKLKQYYLYLKCLNFKYNEDEIIKYLNISKGALFYLRKNKLMLDFEKLTMLFLKLSKMDYNIKKGFFNPDTAFEIFISTLN